jgi:hypothetical protein
MRSKQKGYTLAELVIAVFGVFMAGAVLFVAASIIYAIGKYLFGWW